VRVGAGVRSHAAIIYRQPGCVEPGLASPGECRSGSVTLRS
jgi:hypothetical protein